MECLHLVRPLLEQQTQRNQERAKITTGMRSWGSYEPEDTKGPQTAISEVLATGVRTARDPCTKHHQGVIRPPNPSLQLGPLPTHAPLPSFHLRSRPSLPPGASKGTCFLFLLPGIAAWIPKKPCLNFLFGLY